MEYTDCTSRLKTIKVVRSQKLLANHTINYMTSHRITHKRKPDSQNIHEHITHVAYDGYIYPREVVIKLIAAGTDSFYVLTGSNRSEVGVVYPTDGRYPFLRTHADGYYNDNLLALPEC